jgi:hypothetical protein
MTNKDTKLLKLIKGFDTVAQYSQGLIGSTISVTVYYDFKHLTEERLEEITALLETEMQNAANKLIGNKNNE